MASKEGKNFSEASHEWDVLFEDLGLTLKFKDYSDAALAYRLGFKPGFYVKAFPVLHEDILDKAFMEKLIDSIATEITDRITEGEEPGKTQIIDFDIDLKSGEAYIVEMETYDQKTGIAKFRIHQVTPEEFEKETDGLNLLMPSKNDLPL